MASIASNTNNSPSPLTPFLTLLALCGQLGGAALRNQLTCQLDSEGYYQKTATHDYPSVAELDKVLRRENVRSSAILRIAGRWL